MTPDRKKIYDFVTKNPNVTVNQVVDATGLSRSLCYKYLSTDHFIGTKVKTELSQHMIFSVNNREMIANTDIPRHHYIHEAFWGVGV